MCTREEAERYRKLNLTEHRGLIRAFNTVTEKGIPENT